MNSAAKRQEAGSRERKVNALIGPYKEQASDPFAYNRELEERGSVDVPRATVRRYFAATNFLLERAGDF
jgi:hypothetical protein